MPQPGAQPSPRSPRGGTRRRLLAHRPGRNPVLLISLLAALMMVVAGCSMLPSAGAQEGGDQQQEEGQQDDPPGEDPPQENPDPESDQDNVNGETQDPNADPCDPQGLPEHDGTQTADRGSAVCNRGAMGVLPAADKTPTIRIVDPQNGSEIGVGEDISVTVAFDNFTPGTFDDPNTQYGSRPFSIDENGNAVGHSHLYVQKLNDDEVPSAELDSFLALNEPSDDGTLSGDVPAVSEEGRYRLCTDIAGGNHLTFPKGNAQQGPQMDCIQLFAVNQ